MSKFFSIEEWMERKLSDHLSEIEDVQEKDEMEIDADWYMQDRSVEDDIYTKQQRGQYE